MSVTLIPIITGATLPGVGPWVDVSQVKSGASFYAFVQGGPPSGVSVSIDAMLNGSNPRPPLGNINAVVPLRQVRANIASIAPGMNVTVQMAVYS